MTNDELARRFELCRLAAGIAAARVKLWETWADGELEAQRKGRQ